MGIYCGSASSSPKSAVFGVDLLLGSTAKPVRGRRWFLARRGLLVAMAPQLDEYTCGISLPGLGDRGNICVQNE